MFQLLIFRGVCISFFSGPFNADRLTFLKNHIQVVQDARAPIVINGEKNTPYFHDRK